MTAREGRSATLTERCAPRPSLSSYTTWWDTTVSVLQWPCGAKLRRRLPLGPHPRSGAMLVLIQVSSMKTSRSGSSLACKDRQRCRRRAISARPCSRANRVFFEPQSFAEEELPYRIVRHPYPTRRQLRFQAMQRQVGYLADAFHDERPVRLQNPLAVPAHLARRHRTGCPMPLRPLHYRRHRNIEPRRHRPAALPR